MATEVGIHELPVQDPSPNEFSSSHLTWHKIEGTNNTEDDVALIPFSRVEDFLKGESENVESPTRFRIEGGRKKARLSSNKTPKPDEYSEFRLYWCAFGPDSYGESEVSLPSRKFRVGGRKRAVRPQAMRGCMCHFIIKRLFSKPSVAVIIYNQRRHVDRSGTICHGPLDRNALGPRTITHPYISNELREQALSMIYLGISEPSLLQKYIEDAEIFGGSGYGSDLAVKYVEKLEKVIRRSSYELDPDDLSSVRIWVERHPKNVFFYQDLSETSSFILGIQTEWQLQQMVRFGNSSLMAANTSFGIKKLKYPLYTLLVFDGNKHPLPVAWVISRSFASDDVYKWSKSLHERVCSKEQLWKLSGFIVDDAATEIATIREVFGCPVLLCIWRVHRAWLKNIYKTCSNMEVRREMFKRLGHLMYSPWNGRDSASAVSEFVQDFIDQNSFLKYFKFRWEPKIEMWLAAMRIFPLASQETCGAFEAYHYRLKTRLSDELGTAASERLDWLVHKLTTELHSSYWLDLYSEEKGILGSIREQYINSTSWQRAQQIPDSHVVLSDKKNRFAKVISQSNSTEMHIVWNPDSEFALCDCSWSTLGYICKHVIKVNSVISNLKIAQPSLAFLSYHQLLLGLWQNSPDDSVILDRVSARIFHMERDVEQLTERYYADGSQFQSNSINVHSLSNELPFKWSIKKQRNSKRKPTSNSFSSFLGRQDDAVVPCKSVPLCHDNGRVYRHKKFRTLQSLDLDPSLSNEKSLDWGKLSTAVANQSSSFDACKKYGVVAQVAVSSDLDEGSADSFEEGDIATTNDGQKVSLDPNVSTRKHVINEPHQNCVSTREDTQVFGRKNQWKLKLKGHEINITG